MTPRQKRLERLFSNPKMATAFRECVRQDRDLLGYLKNRHVWRAYGRYCEVLYPSGDWY